MTGKTASSAILKWFAGLSIREASRMPSFGFWIPQQNTIVHADSWPSGECRPKCTVRISAQQFQVFGTVRSLNRNPRTSDIPIRVTSKG